jgi:hypothetical protein
VQRSAGCEESRGECVDRRWIEETEPVKFDVHVELSRTGEEILSWHRAELADRRASHYQ